MNSLLSSVSGLLPLAIASIASSESADAQTSTGVWWILGAAGAAVIFNQLVTAWNNLTGRFKEREGTGPQYQRVEVCEAMHKTITDAIEEVERRQTHRMEETEQRHSVRTEGLRREIKGDVSGVHKRIDEVLKGVSRLEGKVNQ